MEAGQQAFLCTSVLKMTVQHAPNNVKIIMFIIRVANSIIFSLNTILFMTNAVVSLAVLGQALSCWKMTRLLHNGKECGLKNLIRVKFPITCSKSVLPVLEMAAHIIPLPPANPPTSCLQFCDTFPATTINLTDCDDMPNK